MPLAAGSFSLVLVALAAMELSAATITPPRLVYDELYIQHAIEAMEQCKRDPQPQSFWRAANSCHLARNFHLAEQFMLVAIENGASEPKAQVALSIYLGKQRKYAEAIVVLRRALEMPNVDSVHANLILATWEHCIGKPTEARKRYDDVSPDALANATHYGAAACYHAVANNEEQVKVYLRKRLVNDDGQGRQFIAREVLFDKYRECEWFIKLIGITLVR